MMMEAQKVNEMALLTPETTANERTWAAIAHISNVITVLAALSSLGLLGLFFVFVPLVIYLSYKDKSNYVAFHAAQAFALGVVGSLGYFLFILLGIVTLVLMWIIVGLLSAILVGLILIPVAALITAACAFLFVAIPFIFGGFSVVATVQTANGRDYRYPYLGEWVADWLARNKEGLNQPRYTG